MQEVTFQPRYCKHLSCHWICYKLYNCQSQSSEKWVSWAFRFVSHHRARAESTWRAAESLFKNKRQWSIELKRFQFSNMVKTYCVKYSRYLHLKSSSRNMSLSCLEIHPKYLIHLPIHTWDNHPMPKSLHTRDGSPPSPAWGADDGDPAQGQQSMPALTGSTTRHAERLNRSR